MGVKPPPVAAPLAPVEFHSAGSVASFLWSSSLRSTSSAQCIDLSAPILITQLDISDHDLLHGQPQSSPHIHTMLEAPRREGRTGRSASAGFQAPHAGLGVTASVLKPKPQAFPTCTGEVTTDSNSPSGPQQFSK
ncbi:hypothetical protein NDU88_003545 [Pleurodeles waltl]|uniref:Uncharacterized protein n=1 Tax=Pleurodeles waltl TaxID=8319 RepID=A0AAV7SFD5_PLEWA|nr:hypothetical protein NDU88_003545 [Pleurodeles waltl]